MFVDAWDCAFDDLFESEDDEINLFTCMLIADCYYASGEEKVVETEVMVQSTSP